MTQKIVIYASKSGNTKKIAEAVAKELGCEAVKFEDIKALELNKFDFIAIGCYIEKGDASEDFKRFLQEIKDKNLGVFITLGSDPKSDHGQRMLENVCQILEKNGNKILRRFASQGAIDPKFIELMRQTTPQYVTPEREARWAVAANHPDENDLKDAKIAFSGI